MWKGLISGGALFILLYVCGRPWTLGDRPIPAIAPLLSPFIGLWQNDGVKYEDIKDQLFVLDEVQIVMDDRSVPHIFGQRDEDVMRVLGYMHAANRLFQMDLTSRFTGGALSGLLGEKLVSIDKLMHRRGLPWAAENAVAAWQNHPASLALMEAYVDGVNAYISSLSPAEYPIEYKLLGAKPTPWSLYRSACVVKSMAFDLSFRNEDWISTNTREVIGDSLYQYLFPMRTPVDDPVIPRGTSWDYITSRRHPATNSELLTPVGSAPQDHYMEPGIGSNNWAIDGSHTASGYPILCNDPHLKLQLPSIWYECQLSSPTLQVYGVSLPGVPGVIIGFTNKVAWGFTNVAIDVLDWYHIDWIDRSALTYRLNGRQQRAEVLYFDLDVKGKGSIRDSVIMTYWGPITYFDDDHPLKDYAMRWVGHESQNVDEMGVFSRLASAENKEDVLSAAQDFLSPAQNLVFATADGDIGLRVCGAFPIRTEGDGAFLLRGDSTAHGWQQYVPPTDNPVVINPERGFVSSANQISTDDDYPYPYTGYFAHFRGRSLNELLAQYNSANIDDMKEVQLDNTSYLSKDACNMLRACDKNIRSTLNESASKLLDAILKWNGHFEAKAKEPYYFWLWFNQYESLLWDEFNHDDNLKIPAKWQSIHLADSDPQSPFFDLLTTNEKESRDDLIRISLERASTLIDSIERTSPDMNWGEYNANRVSHLLNIPAFSSDINVVDGFKYALNAVSNTHGPSWRMVVELSDPVEAYGIFPGGQSGHPGDPNFDQSIADWAAGRYYRLHLYSDVESAKSDDGHLIEIKP